MTTLPSSLLLSLILLLFITATSGAMTASKISLHAGGYGLATQQIVTQGQPRLIKLLDDFSSAPSIKAAVPGIVVICRIWLTSQASSGDAAAAASAWWGANNGTILANPSCDYFEGYNEPGVGTYAELAWYAAFEVARVRLMAAAGVKAAIGCFSTGTPDITNTTLMEAFNPAIDEAIKHAGILAVHEYSSPYMSSCFSGAVNGTGSGWLTGRYRMWYSEILIPQKRAPLLAITENGIDGVGTMCGGPSFAGYQQACSWWSSQGHSESCEQFYVDQLAWYDQVLRYNSYVIGATVFQIDCYGWSDYDLTPAAQQLTNYLVSQQP